MRITAKYVPQSEYDALAEQFATMSKFGPCDKCGGTIKPCRCTLMAERDALINHVDDLRHLLEKCSPYVYAAVDLARFTDGFKPKRHPIDDLAEELRKELNHDES